MVALALDSPATIWAETHRNDGHGSGEPFGTIRGLIHESTSLEIDIKAETPRDKQLLSAITL